MDSGGELGCPQDRGGKPSKPSTMGLLEQLPFLPKVQLGETTGLNPGAAGFRKD